MNIISNLAKETIHRFGANSFKLHRLSMPRPGEVLSLVGTNGIGKSTAIKILTKISIIFPGDRLLLITTVYILYLYFSRYYQISSKNQ